MLIEDVLEITLLNDFYGNLLSKRQQEVMDLYHEENLSLSEIADDLGISRQAVHDALKNGEKALMGYEEKLGLVDRFAKTQKAVDAIDGKIETLITENIDNVSLVQQLAEIRNDIDRME